MRDFCVFCDICDCLREKGPCAIILLLVLAFVKILSELTVSQPLGLVSIVMAVDASIVMIAAIRK